MSMHMIQGVRVIGSKKKANRKPGWQQAEAEYQAFLKKHGVDTSKKLKKKEFVIYEESKDNAFVRETKYYPSFATKAAAGELSRNDTPRKDRPVYTGDYIIGIATMHKSNMVPVGRGDNPKDYSTMRRG